MRVAAGPSPICIDRLVRPLAVYASREVTTLSVYLSIIMSIIINQCDGDGLRVCSLECTSVLQPYSTHVRTHVRTEDSQNALRNPHPRRTTSSPAVSTPISTEIPYGPDDRRDGGAVWRWQ